MTPMSNAEIRSLIERAKRLARSRGHASLADDFAQDAFIRIAGGRLASLDHLFIDFLRAEYGDSRACSGRLKQFERHGGSSLDAPVSEGEGGALRIDLVAAPGGEPAPFGDARGMPDSLRGRDALIYELHIEEDLSQDEVADILGVTPARICQIVKGRIKPAVEAAYLLGEALDLYRDDPDASKLVIRWITL